VKNKRIETIGIKEANRDELTLKPKILNKQRDLRGVERIEF